MTLESEAERGFRLTDNYGSVSSDAFPKSLPSRPVPGRVAAVGRWAVVATLSALLDSAVPLEGRRA